MTNPQTPGPKRKPRKFSPANLARSVIALPLLEQIDSELAVTESVEQKYPQIREKHNAAVFLQSDFSGDQAQEVLEEFRKQLSEVIQDLGAEASKNVVDDDVVSDVNIPEVDRPVALALLEGDVIRQLNRMIAAGELPVVERIWPMRFAVIVDINLNFRPMESDREDPDPRQVAKKWIEDYIIEAMKAVGVSDRDQRDQGQGVDRFKTKLSDQYVFATLEGRVIKELIKIDYRKAEERARSYAELVAETIGNAPSVGLSEESAQFRTIHHIWPDFALRSCITQSIRTIKVDAARQSFAATGEGITWAVMDTGIDKDHPHFIRHTNIDDNSPYHADFTSSMGQPKPLKDKNGHGTHVAGIIAGEQLGEKLGGGNPGASTMLAISQEISANQRSVSTKKEMLHEISGMAPKCKLVSLKVLDDFGTGEVSNVIAAISHVQAINNYGRDLKIHGVNLSLGHPFNPEWFACGQSPLCVEINRLVKSGVVVVVAAGNTGYGSLQTKEGVSKTCLDLTINDPGNAEYAITVGSTHRHMPHTYGVSYFSSKGPTGDGRCKPDLLAPGEKIISCAAANSKLVEKTFGRAQSKQRYYYFETSGTSMAAPHVSGAIAAFLSIRREFIGEAEKVKQIFTSTATDLGRDRYFQGAGLIDLLRAIESV